MKFIKKLFLPKEVKSALSILDEASQTFGGTGFELVRKHIEKTLRAHPDKFVRVIQKGAPTRQWVYSAIANIAGDLVEGGNYHIYRGMLNPMEPGNEILNIFDRAVDELTKMGVLGAEKARQQKKAIRENIKNVG